MLSKQLSFRRMNVGMCITKGAGSTEGPVPAGRGEGDAQPQLFSSTAAGCGGGPSTRAQAATQEGVRTEQLSRDGVFRDMHYAGAANQTALVGSVSHTHQTACAQPRGGQRKSTG